jgi:hypothetical protein
MQTKTGRANGIVNTITITRPFLIDRKWINQQRYIDKRLIPIRLTISSKIYSHLFFVHVIYSFVTTILTFISVLTSSTILMFLFLWDKRINYIDYIRLCIDINRVFVWVEQRLFSIVLLSLLATLLLFSSSAFQSSLLLLDRIPKTF